MSLFPKQLLILAFACVGTMTLLPSCNPRKGELVCREESKLKSVIDSVFRSVECTGIVRENALHLGMAKDNFRFIKIRPIPDTEYVGMPYSSNRIGFPVHLGKEDAHLEVSGRADGIQVGDTFVKHAGAPTYEIRPFGGQGIFKTEYDYGYNCPDGNCTFLRENGLLCARDY